MASLLILKSTVEALRKDKRKVCNTRKCRVCNGNQADVPIFNEIMETNLAHDIQNFSGVTITKADRFSKFMCQQCLDLLNNCLLFKELCNKTDKLLNEVPKVVKKTRDHNNTTNAQKKTRVDSCFVPMCPATSTRFPNKLFLTGPSDPKLRKKWYQAAKRIDHYSPKTIIRCCEDHFDLESDVENWMKFKLCGGKLFLKKNVVPHIFECQNRIMPLKHRSVIMKRKRHEIIENFENNPAGSCEKKEIQMSYTEFIPATGHKKKDPKEICNWRCSYCPVLFRDLKSYYDHVPQCDLQHSAGQTSPQRNCNEQSDYEDQDDTNPPDNSMDDDPLIDTSDIFQDDETKEFSDDSYSVPSPTFSDDNGLRCPACQRFFCDSQSYNKHLSYSKTCKGYSNQHNEEKPEPKPKGNPKALCEICGKTVSKPTIVAHKRLHKNVFPYACDTCPYRGRTKNLLVVHMRSHMTVKPYKCTICSKTMISTSNLTRHMETNHGDNKTACKGIQCPECGKEFRYMQSMKEHVANVHRDQPRVECDICFKTFRPKHLNRHRRKVHKLNIPKSDLPSNRLPSYIKCMMEESFDNEHDDLVPETSGMSLHKK